MIKIITDTTASLTIEEYNRYGICAVPLYVRQGDITKKELYEISYDQFYSDQRNGIKFTTSQPDPQAFIDTFRPIIENGDEVICITISSHISGTINSASLAKDILETEQISIFDSQQSGFGQAALAIKAAELAQNGRSRTDILVILENMRRNSRIYFVVESLRYLYEGGRLSGAQALFGSLIQIKPIIWFDEIGMMTPIEKVRTLKAAKSKTLDLIKERIPFGIETAGLHYGDNLEEAIAYQKSMEEIIQKPVSLIKLSPVIATHTGPDILGPCIITRN